MANYIALTVRAEHHNTENVHFILADGRPNRSCLRSGRNTEFWERKGIRIRRLTPMECERFQDFPDGGVVRDEEAVNEDLAVRLQEERRLMYVGITRAQRSLAVSWTRRRKKGRELVAALPSRFIAEMALNQATVKEDPREKLRALRAEFALKAQASAAAAASAR